MIYRETRNYDNQQRRIFSGHGDFDMPLIPACSVNVNELASARWISFNHMLTEPHPEECVLHFFVDDYQFDRVWNNPDRYLDRLRKFKAVCSTDFSMYTDFPNAVNLHNCFKNHWLGAYWAENGVNVIPVVGWSNDKSFDYCFDGYEVGCEYLAIATTGTVRAKDLFTDGLFRMVDKLKPKNLFVYSDRAGLGMEQYSQALDTHVVMIKNEQIERLRKLKEAQ